MADTVQLELSLEEFCHLAEMCAMSLTFLEPLSEELAYESRYHAWKKLAEDMLAVASTIPTINPLMEYNERCSCWFFRPTYIQSSFYGKLMLRTNETIFWRELVKHMTDQVFGSAPLPPYDERQRALYEQGLWDEFERYGLSRMSLVPPSL